MGLYQEYAYANVAAHNAAKKRNLKGARKNLDMDNDMFEWSSRLYQIIGVEISYVEGDKFDKKGEHNPKNNMLTVIKHSYLVAP